LNLANESDFLLDENLSFLNLTQDLKMFNIYLKESDIEKVLLKSINIKRNILSKEKNSSQQGVFTGWIKENYAEYKCKFKCNSAEGRVVDFGDNNVILDGKEEKGKTFIKYGTHEIKIRSRFFTPNTINEKSIQSVRQLRSAIPDYPYNPRYIIEGFDYGKNFKGEKVFHGFSDQRGCDLKKVSLSELEDSYDSYSIVEYQKNLYFVVKQIDSLGIEEDYDITYRKNISENGNLLFIKAILKTQDPRRAPSVDKIQVRVL
jgi:hypothetical protein